MPLLNPGERVLLQEPTENGAGRDGVLFLTNLRVLFEGEAKRGLVTSLVRGKAYVTIFESHLLQVTNVHRDKPLIGRATLRVEAHGRGHVFRVHDADAWSSAIITARGSAPRPQAQAPVTVNVAMPAQQGPQVYLHCRHCGSLVTPSSAGPALHCSSCGAAL